jgi:tetratricopeptide (TPR) repeat protein
MAVKALIDQYGISQEEIALWKGEGDEPLKIALLDWIRLLLEGETTDAARKIHLNQIHENLSVAMENFGHTTSHDLEESTTRRKMMHMAPNSAKKTSLNGNKVDAEQNRPTAVHRMILLLVLASARYHDLWIRFNDLMSQYSRIEIEKMQSGDFPRNSSTLMNELNSMGKEALEELEKLENMPLKGLIEAEMRQDNVEDDLSEKAATAPNQSHQLLNKLQFEWLLLQLNLLHLQFRCYHSSTMTNRSTSSNPLLHSQLTNLTMSLVLSVTKAIGMNEMIKVHLLSKMDGSNLYSSSIRGRNNESSSSSIRTLNYINSMQFSHIAHQGSSKGGKDSISSNVTSSVAFLPSQGSDSLQYKILSRLPTHFNNLLTSIQGLLLISPPSPSFSTTDHDPSTKPSSHTLSHTYFLTSTCINELLIAEHQILENIIFLLSSLPQYNHLWDPIMIHHHQQQQQQLDNPPSVIHSSGPKKDYILFKSPSQLIHFTVESLSQLYRHLELHGTILSSQHRPNQYHSVEQFNYLQNLCSLHLYRFPSGLRQVEMSPCMAHASSDRMKCCWSFVEARKLFLAGNLDTALQAFQQLLPFKFQLAQVWNYIGVIEMQNRRPWQSLTSFKESVKQDASFLPALYNISRLYHKERKHESELKLLELLQTHVEDQEENQEISPSYRISTIGPHNSPLKSLLVLWRISKCYSSLNQFNLALEKLEKIQKMLASLPKASFSAETSIEIDPLIDSYPLFNMTIVMHELARMYLNMSAPEKVLDLYGLSSNGTTSSQKNYVTNDDEQVKSPKYFSKVDDWENGRPDPIAILLVSEAFLRIRKSLESIKWLTFLNDLCEETRKYHDDKESTRLRSHTSSNTSMATNTTSSIVFRGQEITKCYPTISLFDSHKSLLLYFDSLTNYAATLQCRQEYSLAMNGFSKAKSLAILIQEKHIASQSESFLPTTITTTVEPVHIANRLLVSHYNFSLLAFKIGNTRIAASEWISFRFKIQNFFSLSSTEPLAALKAQTTKQLNAINKATMTHNDIVFANGEIPLWQILELDSHLLTLSIKLYAMGSQT